MLAVKVGVAVALIWLFWEVESAKGIAVFVLPKAIVGVGGVAVSGVEQPAEPMVCIVRDAVLARSSRINRLT